MDTLNHVAVLASPLTINGQNQASGSRYYVENSLEEMDEAGEFYVDAINRKLLYAGAPGDDLRKDAPENWFWLAAGPRELVVLRGDDEQSPVRNVTIANIEFSHTAVEDGFITQGASGQSGDFLTTAAVHASFAESVRLQNCTLRALGGYGVWLEQGAFDGAVSGCMLPHLGAGGVRIGRGHSFSGRASASATPSQTT